MNTELDKQDNRDVIIRPADIENKSFEIISGILREMGREIEDKAQEPVIKRVIHTTADFEYLDTLCFSEGAVEKIGDALRSGADIITDTNMARAGINKTRLGKYGGRVHCFMSDEDVASEAKARGVTRAVVSMDKAAKLEKEGRRCVFAIGNAPTALMELYELMREDRIHPYGIIGVPVGFVNVVEAKEMILQTEVPHIVARGRKGGSNVAAAICNAILYNL